MCRCKIVGPTLGFIGTIVAIVICWPIGMAQATLLRTKSFIQMLASLRSFLLIRILAMLDSPLEGTVAQVMVIKAAWCFCCACCSSCKLCLPLQMECAVQAQSFGVATSLQEIGSSASQSLMVRQTPPQRHFD